MVTVKVKRLTEDAVLPKYAYPGDACMDLTCTEISFDERLGISTFHTGLAFDIPEGFVGLVFPRSSIYKTGDVFANSVGVIDSGYKGEVTIKTFYANSRHKTKPYEVGDRVGQIMFVPRPMVQLEEVNELSLSERGTGGYGSSGK